jgi:hypothetical protein
MKTSKTSATKSSKKIQIEEAPIQDAVNLENIKIDVSKIDANVLSKEKITTEKHLYIGMENKSSEEKKKHRGKIRRDLDRFVNQILGKDRSAEERAASILSFLDFYKSNWKITDFKIDNFSQIKEKEKIQDYKDLLDAVKQSMG